MNLFSAVLFLLLLKYGQGQNPQCPDFSSFDFPNANQITDYVLYGGGGVPAFNRLSICMWVTLSPLASNGPPFISYQISGSSANHFLIIYLNGRIRVDVNGIIVANYLYPESELYDRTHICFTFDVSTTSKQLIINGVPVAAASISGSAISASTVLTAGGTLLLGQEQDSVQGGFAASQSFTGEISNVVIYDRVLTQQELNDIYTECECPDNYVIAFTDDVVTVVGGASSTLQNCSVPLECPPLTLSTSDPFLSLGSSDGSDAPYTPEEEFQYSCARGFLSEEEEFRTCQDDETWSGSEPVCEPVCPEVFFHFPRPYNTSDVVEYTVSGFPSAVGNFTMCFWLSIADASADYSLFYDGDNSEIVWSLQTGELLFELAGTTVQRLTVTSPGVSIPYEAHICTTNMLNVFSNLYINMELQTGTSQGFIVRALDPVGNINIGQFENGGTGLASMGNNISNIAIYDRVLSIEELRNIYMGCECPLDYVFPVTGDVVTLVGEAQMLNQACPVPVMCPELTLSGSVGPYLQLDPLSAFPYTPQEQFQYSCTRGTLTGDEFRTCQNDGTWLGSEPICAPSCPENSFFNFPRTNQITDYIVYTGSIPTLTQFTVCIWFQLADDAAASPSIVSYQIGTSASVNDLVFILLNNQIRVDVNHRTLFDAPFSGTFQDNTHACIAVDSLNPTKQLFFNGEELMDNLGGVDVISTSVINTGGDLILGQEQDAPLGSFAASQSFAGNASNLVFYDRVLSDQEIMEVYSDCQCPLDYVIAFTSDNTMEFGQARSLPMECPIPLQCPILTLSVSAGPQLQLNPVSGSEDPYTPGEQFQYSCARGELVGDEFRTCQNNGEWSGTEPTCEPSCVSTLFHFPSGSSVESYVQLTPEFNTLGVFTICLWFDVEQPTTTQSLTLISYYTSSEQILWQITPNELVLVVNGRTIQEYVHMNATFGAEVHMCATSSAVLGSTSLYINGIEISPLGGLNPGISTTVEASGVFILGQQQESNGGGFQATNSFTAGNISNVVVWNRVLSVAEISNNYGSCECPLDYDVALLSGNVMLNGQVTNPASSCPVPVECPVLSLSAGASQYLDLNPLAASPYTPGEQFQYTCTRGTRVGGDMSTCQNDGTWLGSEPDCEATCPLSSFFNFPRANQVEDYVQYVVTDTFPEITDLSVCFWVEMSDTISASPAMISYNTLSMDNELSVLYSSGAIVIRVDDRTILEYTTTPLTSMTHICFTSEPSTSTAELYINGNPVPATADSPMASTIVQGGGQLILGQDQNSLLAGFEAVNSFTGNISSFIIWDRILTAQDVTSIYQDCTCPLDYVVALTQETTLLHGQAQILPMTCPVPFECEAISVISDLNLVLNDIPGSVPPYTLGEQVVYNCTLGELQGDPIRTCQSNETWAGQEPTCFLQCPASEVVLDNLMRVGGTVPFIPGDAAIYISCNVGILVGGQQQRFCMADETWDGTAPTCSNVTVNCGEMPEISVVPQAYGRDSFAGYSVVIASDSRGGPDSCYPTTLTDDLATFNISIDSCSPTTTDAPNYLVYTYTLWLHKLDRETIQRYEDQCVSVTCNMDKSELVNSDYVNPVKTTYKIEVNNDTGVLNLPIGLYTTPAFDTPFSGNPPTVAVPDIIYVRVGPVSIDDDIIIQATQCWATPTQNGDNERRFDIIDDSCDYNGTIIRNYDVSADFYFESFQWRTGNVQVLYVHCTIVLCEEETEDDCRVSPSCARRRKRSLPSDNEHLLTAGPIKLYYDQNTLCQINNGGCEEFCAVKDMGIVCMCSPGKLLSEDGFSCIDVVSEVQEVALRITEEGIWFCGVAILALLLFVVLMLFRCKKKQSKLFINSS